MHLVSRATRLLLLYRRRLMKEPPLDELGCIVPTGLSSLEGAAVRRSKNPLPRYSRLAEDALHLSSTACPLICCSSRVDCLSSLPEPSAFHAGNHVPACVSAISCGMASTRNLSVGLGQPHTIGASHDRFSKSHAAHCGWTDLLTSSLGQWSL